MLPFSYFFPVLYGPSELSILKLFRSYRLNLTSSNTKNSGSGPKYDLSPIPDFLDKLQLFAVPLGSLS